MRQKALTDCCFDCCSVMQGPVGTRAGIFCSQILLKIAGVEGRVLGQLGLVMREVCGMQQLQVEVRMLCALGIK
jgi:hypothetical protein